MAGFPLHPGCRWSYAVTESDVLRDTVTVEILSDTLIPGASQATVWQYVSGRGSFRGVAARNADSVNLSFPTDQPFPPFSLVFPLIYGHTWSGPAPLHDWNSVTVSDSLNLPIGPIASAFVIEQQWWTLNDRGDVYRWVAPGIGVVQLHYSRVGTTIIDEQWQLISVKVRGPAGPM
jgi:hypothetical protein